MTDLIKIVIRNMSDSTMHALIQAHRGDFVLFPLRRFAAFQKVDAAAAAFLKSSEDKQSSSIPRARVNLANFCAPILQTNRVLHRAVTPQNVSLIRIELYVCESHDSESTAAMHVGLNIVHLGVQTLIVSQDGGF